MYTDIHNTDKTYQLLYVDPPWQQSKGGKKSVRPNSSGKGLDYAVCSLDEIEEHLRIANSHTEENAVLFLWTIDKYLFEAQAIAEKFGYKLHARMIWNKVTGIPAAFTVRYGHEYLLYMYKGKLTPVATEQRGKIHTVFTERATKHSKNQPSLMKSSKAFILNRQSSKCMPETHGTVGIAGAMKFLQNK